MTVVYDDRDPIVQYTGTWGKGGDPDEYRMTTTWTATVGDTARVTFTGRGISAYGAISPNTPGRGKGPIATFMIDNDPSTRTRFAPPQIGVPQRQFLMHSVSGLDYGEHVLTMTNESAEGFFFVDFIEVMGTERPQSSSASPSSSSRAPAIDPTPNAPPVSSTSPSSASSDPESSGASRPSNGPTSVPNPSSSGSPPRSSQLEVGSSALLSHSLLLPPGVSGATADHNSTPTSISPGSSEGGSGGTGIRLDAIIGGTVGGIAATCTLFLIFALWMRRRQRKRYGNIESPPPEMQKSSLQPRISPYPTSDLTDSNVTSLVKPSVLPTPSFDITQTYAGPFTRLEQL
ncbi:hypothetical protein BKA70DRAFT_712986 [Coprinopsis sp. MPI-PUGE-AT-0042]|nr:hypothetical protein BKA70DRAFT_712986 [Coprinopsis sp. MPI-PUGE-AT-0042]